MNSTGSPYEIYPDGLREAFRIVYLFLVGPIFFTNLLVVVSVVVCRQLRECKHVCLLSLSMADVAVGIGFVACFLKERAEDFLTYKGPCLLCLFFVTLGPATSLYSVLLISVERYVKVVHSHRHARLFSCRRTVLWVVCLWCYCLVGTFVLLFWNRFSDNTPCSLEDVAWPLYLYIVIFLQMVLLLVTNGALYVFILTKVVQQRKQIQDVSLQNKSRQAERKAHTLVLIVLGILYLCWLPYFVVNIIPDRTSLGHFVSYYLALTFIAVNSAINPILYVWRNDTFRQAFKQVLTCGTLAQTRAESLQTS